jgi:hypothetical protein
MNFRLLFWIKVVISSFAFKKKNVKKKIHNNDFEKFISMDFKIWNKSTNSKICELQISLYQIDLFFMANSKDSSWSWNFFINFIYVTKLLKPQNPCLYIYTCTCNYISYLLYSYTRFNISRQLERSVFGTSIFERNLLKHISKFAIVNKFHIFTTIQCAIATL